jgi:hypothetical protein
LIARRVRAVIRMMPRISGCSMLHARDATDGHVPRHRLRVRDMCERRADEEDTHQRGKCPEEPSVGAHHRRRICIRAAG